MIEIFELSEIPEALIKEFVQEIYKEPLNKGKLIPKSDIAMYALDNEDGHTIGVFNKEDIEFYLMTGYPAASKEIEVWLWMMMELQHRGYGYEVRI